MTMNRCTDRGACERIDQCPCPSLCQGFCMKVTPHPELGSLDDAMSDAALEHAFDIRNGKD